MSEIERITITLPADMTALVKGVVAGGDYASSSEVWLSGWMKWRIEG